MAANYIGDLVGRPVLVTGGTGFIGSHLVGRLVEEGAQVSVLVRDPAHAGRLDAHRGRIRLICADLRGANSLNLGLLQPEVVFHLAAHGVEGPLADLEEAVSVNVLGTAHLLAVLSGTPGAALRSFVYAGTDFEYGLGDAPRTEADPLCPTNYYAASKSAGWLFCKAFAAVHQIPVVGVRPFLTYGPDQGRRRFVPYVIIAAIMGQEVKLTGGEQVRDLVYVGDVVDGILSASRCTVQGEVFNLGSGLGFPLRAVVSRIIELTGSNSRPRLGAIPYRDGEIWDLRADVSKAMRKLGWSARTTLDDGLRQTINWYRSHLSQFT